jgi:hypothetical protein
MQHVSMEATKGDRLDPKLNVSIGWNARGWTWTKNKQRQSSDASVTCAYICPQSASKSRIDTPDRRCGQ